MTIENCDSVSTTNLVGHCMSTLPLYPELDEEILEKNIEKMETKDGFQKRGKYFYYDSPLHEDTGVWIPVSIPPMLEGDHEEWGRGFHSYGGYFPEGDMGGNQYLGEEKELTMWDVLVEILLAARVKLTSFSSGDVNGNFLWLSSHVLEQAWREMAQTLTEANFEYVRELLETEPPNWLADSASAASCMLLAKGLAIITVVKVGMMVTYNVGTGLVVVRREDGSWSAPSAISTLRVGWEPQAGGVLTDFIIVLRTNDAVKTFSGNVHFSVGAGESAAVGVVGRAVEADVRAGDGGYAACYTYSCSEVAFVGCSLEGSIREKLALLWQPVLRYTCWVICLCHLLLKFSTVLCYCRSVLEA